MRITKYNSNFSSKTSSFSGFTSVCEKWKEWIWTRICACKCAWAKKGLFFPIVLLLFQFLSLSFAHILFLSNISFFLFFCNPFGQQFAFSTLWFGHACMFVFVFFVCVVVVLWMWMWIGGNASEQSPDWRTVKSVPALLQPIIFQVCNALLAELLPFRNKLDLF